MPEIASQNRETGDAFLAAMRRLLRPLVRLLIARSITFPSIADVLRGLYVEVAVNAFPVGDKPQTDSRITLLTGIHRKDVKRLRGQRHPALRPPRTVALGSQLLARWTTMPEYLDAHGDPQPLSRIATHGSPHSFESLVRSINTDIRPRVVLDEWLRLGIVSVDGQDRVCLNVAAFIPPRGSAEMTYYFGRNLHDHIAAAVHNMMGEAGTAGPLFERSVNYNNLSSAAVAELNAIATQRAMEVLHELNGRALQLQQRDSGKPGASQRFNFGLYEYIEDQTAETPAEPDDHE